MESSGHKKPGFPKTGNPAQEQININASTKRKQRHVLPSVH
jgi:hypothetical protein